MRQDFLQKYGESIVIALLSLLMLGFIVSYIPPSLLFANTIPAGGDTAAHYYPAWYLTTHLLPQLSIIGWAPGWYAGFPLFQFYFPLPFLLIAALSAVFTLPVAFKLVTFLAIIAIPFGAYAFLRLLRFSTLVAGIGAVFTLPFLFMEAYSMWGGNIPSTFAGEFSYAIGIALSFVYLGCLYRGIDECTHAVRNALLLAAIGFTHIYTLLWVVFSSLFLLSGPDFKKRFAYWFHINAIAFLVLSFWLLPLVYYASYTTTFAIKWILGWKEVFPQIFWPFAVLALIGIVCGIRQRDKRVSYLLFSAAVAAAFYFIAVHIGVVDIRFIPFIQLSLLLVAAYPFVFLDRTKARGVKLAPILLLLLTILWVQPHIHFIPDWAKWNYQGFETKHLWEQYSAVQHFLNGTENDPRVVYENSDRNNAAGSIRVFELLPYFSGRSTLEGLYLQSTPTAPFVFYIQSETSRAASCPFPMYKCSPFNLANGTEHLKLFNVKHFVAISEEVKGLLRNSSVYRLVFTQEPYEVFELITNETGYVTIPKYKPLFFPRTNWQRRSYDLFKDYADVPVVFDASVKQEQPLVLEPLNRNCTVTSELRQEEIFFNTTCVGMPHLVKVSYFPRWKSANGEKIYLVSPSFMLIYPTKEQTRLYFGRTWVENGALALSILGWLIVIAYAPLMRAVRKRRTDLPKWLREMLF